MNLIVTNNADSGTGSLRNAIAQANSGDTIQFNLAANSTITLTSGQIEVGAGKNIIIDGGNTPNLTISGNNASRIFNIRSIGTFSTTTFTVKNLTLAKAKTTDVGGAINVNGEECTINVDNVNFNDNVADQGGGAIYSQVRGYLNIDNSTFARNNGTLGNTERGGGAITFRGPNNMSVTNTDFIDNKGVNGAAINSVVGELFVQNCRFINNSTTDAYYDTGKLNPFLRGHGGAIFCDKGSDPNETRGSISILDSVFDGNNAKGQGGAVSIFTNPIDKVVIEGSVFNNNSVVAQTNGNPGNGGAIAQISDTPNQGFSVDNSTFSNNTATAQGGGIYKDKAHADITNSTFFNNKAINPANPTSSNIIGGAMSLHGPGTVTNCTLAQNYASWMAGGIGSDTSNIVVKNTIFDTNTASNGGNPWKMKLTTNYQLTNGGNNIQYPDLTSGPWDRPNDVYATANILIADPKLGPLQDNGGLTKTMAPLPGSPAIDGGTSVNAPITDQRGSIRPADGDGNGSAIIDIGAYELGASGTLPNNPEIQVLDGSNNITDGTLSSIDFGKTTVGNPLIKTLTINNLGAGSLDLSNLQLPTGFSFIGSLPTTVNPSSQVSLAIQLDATALGKPNGVISFHSNDQDENPFNFLINGTVFNIVNGTAANDTINHIAVTSVVDELINGLDGNDTVSAGSANDSLMGGAGNDSLFGSSGNDSLMGGADNDSLIGGTGNDSLIGGTGNDIYTIDAGDTITETSTLTTEIDTIIVDSSYTLGANLENLTLTGTNNINGNGNYLNNRLTGNNANNNLIGGNGNDSLTGNLGNDTLNGDAGNDNYLIDAGDTIIETSTLTTEIDVVQATCNWTLGNNLENLTLTGTTNINGNGNGLNNILVGNTANNSLIGGNGNDTLNAGTGNDTLTGGLGNDSLTTGTGNDFVVFNFASHGADRILDFDPVTDTIQVSAAGFGGGLTSGATITSSQFVLGTTSTDSQTRFIYNSSNANLLFDPDGTGSLTATQLAIINNNAAITNADIFVIV